VQRLAGLLCVNPVVRNQSTSIYSKWIVYRQMGQRNAATMIGMTPPIVIRVSFQRFGQRSKRKSGNNAANHNHKYRFNGTCFSLWESMPQEGRMLLFEEQSDQGRTRGVGTVSTSDSVFGRGSQI
jgi:hypothetical protein